MNTNKVIAELEKKYPGKTIIKNDEKNPTEILCEIEPTGDHSDYSIAIAVIDKSIPHYHQHTTETYRILEGSLNLYLNEEKKHLKKGESYTIKPGIQHYAEGKETWIEATSHPGWTLNDHIVLE